MIEERINIPTTLLPLGRVREMFYTIWAINLKPNPISTTSGSQYRCRMPGARGLYEKYPCYLPSSKHHCVTAFPISLGSSSRDFPENLGVCLDPPLSFVGGWTFWKKTWLKLRSQMLRGRCGWMTSNHGLLQQREVQRCSRCVCLSVLQYQYWLK